jgi:cytochrome c oxidase cbb3-type subunit 3
MWRASIFLIFAASAAQADDTGGVLFKTHCAPCHGDKGEGGRGANLAVKKLPRAPDDAALASLIANGIPGSSMPATRMTDDERTQLVQFVRTLGHAGAAQASAGSVTGDRTRGEQIFRTKGNCVKCHMVSGRGGRMGPDLSDVGSHRGPAFLRTSMLDPEAEVPETFSFYRRVIYMTDAYLRVRVVTKDGKQITGTRMDEDSFTIQLRDDGDHIYSFRKSELQELHKDWGKSPMPSYRNLLSSSEVEDVVAYLASLQDTP